MEKPIQDMITEVEGYLEKGFSAVKIRGGYNIKQDIEIVKSLRDNLGYHFDLMLDAGQNYVSYHWSVKEAIDICKTCRISIIFCRRTLHN